jgi:hypothetical protein
MITLNVDICEVDYAYFSQMGAQAVEVVELNGPAGGNPNINLTFDSAEKAKAFLNEFYEGDEEMVNSYNLG